MKLSSCVQTNLGIQDIIKVRGWQVSPAELEAALLSHPMICDAAVLGVDLDDERGELPRAYITVERDKSHSLEQPTDEDILAFMGDRLAKYKALAGGIERVGTIPRGPSGKILKARMKEEALNKIKVLPSKGSKNQQIGINRTNPRKRGTKGEDVLQETGISVTKRVRTLNGKSNSGASVEQDHARELEVPHELTNTV